MAKHVTRQQLILKEKAGEYEYEESMRDNPLGQRSRSFDMFQQQEEEAECDCRRYAHLAQCCEICHEYHPLRKVTLLNGEVIRVCAPIDRAIRPAYYAEQDGLRLTKQMSTADGRRFLAKTWLSIYNDQRVMFALQAWNETASEDEKVDFISTVLEKETLGKSVGGNL